ncbi:hypothetical protein PRIPAC_78250 [Pristionchus pacificus]|uniref:Uncharacterized protein n=1 Tax=Pristionchus pacificus TaxID=54126 RepID=A0A2A6CJC3_PRIPA|nr:hypothetical protein PRIPAC_78250 [Pristionchus pacificus]|eukprot:PDM78216.1 hypothetical protein PRIPAC_30795 [Pristionchus pacificus]
MDVAVKVVDYILLGAQSYLLLRIFLSRNAYFKTPFYFFFLVTATFATTPFIEKLFRIRWNGILQMINVFGVTGSTIGKMYITAHRYAVMKHSSMLEGIWSNLVTAALCIILLFISFIPCVTIYFCGYRFTINGEVIVVAYMDDACIVVTKSESCTVYFIFIVVSLVLAPLTSRQLYKIQQCAEAKQKTTSKIVTQQRRMFIVVAVCVISHFIKSIQQFCWVFTASFHLTEFSAVLASLYTPIHYLATYSASVTLVIFSEPVRRLLISWRDVGKLSPNGSIGVRSSAAPSTFVMSIK